MEHGGPFQNVFFHRLVCIFRYFFWKFWMFNCRRCELGDFTPRFQLLEESEREREPRVLVYDWYSLVNKSTSQRPSGR